MIAGLSVGRGEKVSTLVNVSRLPPSTAHQLQIPITVISGSQAGPTLCITAGMHSTEYAPIVASHKLAKTVMPEDLSGNLVILPLVNPFGVETLSLRVNPIDNVNLNRIFPGDPSRSASYQMAHFLLAKIITKADYYIDIHSGELNESLYPFGIYCSSRYDNELSQRSLALLQCFTPITNVWKVDLTEKEEAADERGEDSASEDAQSGFSITQAFKKKVASAIVEIGNGGAVDRATIDMILDCFQNVLAHLGMNGKAGGFDERGNHALKVTEKAFYLKINNNGIAYLSVKAGEKIRAGGKLAEIRSLQDDILETVVSPSDSIVVVERVNPLVRSGDILFLLLGLS
ncbi:MAG TPA: succinylglutamate desuccinylase/aspartoacylase family protein [Nitrososphaerales archaeon]|nr:succinylglutamate desuccinylase/aspartoacylase family protein [Nitrososphaerales archaeon]